MTDIVSDRHLCFLSFFNEYVVSGRICINFLVLWDGVSIQITGASSILLSRSYGL